MKLNIIVHKEKDGYWAEVPALKGCFTQGDTVEEIVENIKEAITAWLDVESRLKNSKFTINFASFDK